MSSAVLPTARSRETRRLLATHARGRRTVGVAALVCLVGAAGAALAVPPLLGAIVDVAVDRRPRADVTWPVVGLAAAAVVQALLTGVGGQLTARFGETILARLREQVVDRALGLPTIELERGGRGDLLSRVSNDVSAVSDAVREVLPTLARAVLLVGLTVVGLLALDWRLALASLVVLPIHVLGLRWYLRRVVPVYRRRRIADGERTQQLLVAVGGAPTARALGLGDGLVASVRERSSAAVKVTFEGTRLQGTRFMPIVNGAELLGLGAVLAVGFALVRSGQISVGEASAAALYFHRAFDPVGELLFLFDDAQDALSSLDRLAGVALLDPPAVPAADAAPDGTLVLEGVGHSYVAGHPVLGPVDLVVHAGERVALIGTTGAGKTTLARIAAGVLEPTSGSVAVGGAPPRATTADGRPAVALVTQDVHVFAGPLADDLRLAAPNASEDRLRAALERVGADAWVAALPDGLQTMVGHGGHPLSSTRAQQLALARLILRDPVVAVLDEATAEAGSAGARELERAADEALRGRTALVVAHRLTQAQRADRIVVLDGGAIVEQGGHEELLARGGRYAQLWAAWAAPRDGGARVP